MRLVSFHTDDHPVAAAAVQIGDHLVPASALDAPAMTVRGLLEALDIDGLREVAGRAERASERIALADVTLHAPITDPQKIICLGLNYRDHAEESNQEIPSAPMWFAKFANSLVGSGQDIVLPAAHSEYVDYEAELALVIGRTARNVAAEDAFSHIAGAMPFNEVSARDLQLQNPLWTSGKAIDTFAPCGPALVTLDEINDLRATSLSVPRSTASCCSKGRPQTDLRPGRGGGVALEHDDAARLIVATAAPPAWPPRRGAITPATRDTVELGIDVVPGPVKP